MKKAVLATVAIWLTGVSSAAALVSTLSKPPVAPKPVAEAPVAPAPEPSIDIDKFKVPGARIINVPTQVVTSQIRAAVKPKREMKCSEFRSLQFGPVNSGVRYCK